MSRQGRAGATQPAGTGRSYTAGREGRNYAAGRDGATGGKLSRD